MLFTSTFSHLVISFNETAENGGAFTLTLNLFFERKRRSVARASRHAACAPPSGPHGRSLTRYSSCYTIRPGNIANLMFSLCLIFCGVLASPGVFPHFWMYVPLRFYLHPFGQPSLTVST